jgi:hypothetical protein
MHKAVSVLYNASGDASCYNATQLQGPAGPDATWLFQWCTQRSAQELPYFPANGAGRGAKPCPPGTLASAGRPHLLAIARLCKRTARRLLLKVSVPAWERCRLTGLTPGTSHGRAERGPGAQAAPTCSGTRARTTRPSTSASAWPCSTSPPAAIGRCCSTAGSPARTPPATSSSPTALWTPGSPVRCGPSTLP